MNNIELDIERAILRSSALFLKKNLGFDVVLTKLLKEIGSIIEANRAYIFIFSKDEKEANTIYEWYEEETILKSEKLIEVLCNEYSKWIVKLKKDEFIIIEDAYAIGFNNNFDENFLHEFSIKSLLIIPMYSNDNLIGFMGFDYMNQTRIWNESIISVLKLLADTILNAFEGNYKEKVLMDNKRIWIEFFNNEVDMKFAIKIKDYGLPEKIIEVNETACRKLGYRREEILQFTIEDMNNHIVEENVVRVLSDPEMSKHIAVDMTFLSKSGNKIYVDVNLCFFIFNGKGVVLAIARDISKDKYIERKLMENNETLKETVEKLQKTQEQLIQQGKLAAIGRLSAGVAHEINNPLGFIYSNFETTVKYFNQYNEMIKTYKDFINTLVPSDEHCLKIQEIKRLEEKYDINFISSDIGELFDDTLDGLKRISEIVMGLKTFTRVDLKDEFDDYDLNKSIKNTMTLVRSEMKNCVNYIERLNDIPNIEVNGSEINQVLLNVVLNAIYAVKSNKQDSMRNITISTDVEDGFVSCQIEDDGAGIEDKNIKKIFDPFFTTKPIGQGTGLGLSIAYDIVVNKHKGKMTVESQLGIGTKFIVILPIKQIEN